MLRQVLWALASLAVCVACARSEAPSETVRSPATVSSHAEPKAAPPSERIGSSKPAADMDLAAAENALAEASKELGGALALATPDCAVVHPLRDRICELSDRICDLAGADPEIRARCDDGKRRCADAKERVATQCP